MTACAHFGDAGQPLEQRPVPLSTALHISMTTTSECEVFANQRRSLNWSLCGTGAYATAGRRRGSTAAEARERERIWRGERAPDEGHPVASCRTGPSERVSERRGRAHPR